MTEVRFRNSLICVLFFFFVDLFPQTTCLNFSTYFGKLAQDEIKGVCSDNQHNIYVIGTTTNTDIPVTAGAFQTNLKGGYESFLCKFDSCGNMIWCTYLGSSGFDTGEKIVYSPDNTIVICGYTNGSDLATTAGCFQSTSGGDYDCFVGKFSTNGNPIWLSYFGSSAGDFAFDVKIDLLGNIVIGGTSMSPSIYTNASSFQQNLAGATDAFIARFSPSGNLRFSTFYGGTGSEDIHALGLDADCNIIGTGGSFSSNLNTSPGCLQSTSNGGMEVYVIKLDSSGQRIFSTYIGSSGTDDAFGIVTDNVGNIYLSGHTTGAFTTTPGAYQSTVAGGNDGYCLKLDAGGSLQWSTLIGGSGTDLNARMSINSMNELAVLISSQSNDFPMIGVGNYTLQSGASDNVLVTFTSAGTPFWSSYIGGSQGETPYDIVNVTSKKVVLVGETSSPDYPLSGNSYQNNNGGFSDGFITFRDVPTITISGVSEWNGKICEEKIAIEDQLKMISFGEKKCLKYCNYLIRDVLGNDLKHGPIQDDKIDIAELPQGIFFLVLNDPSGNGKCLKFINR